MIRAILVAAALWSAQAAQAVTTVITYSSPKPTGPLNLGAGSAEYLPNTVSANVGDVIDITWTFSDGPLELAYTPEYFILGLTSQNFQAVPGANYNLFAGTGDLELLGANGIGEAAYKSDDLKPDIVLITQGHNIDGGYYSPNKYNSISLTGLHTVLTVTQAFGYAGQTAVGPCQQCAFRAVVYGFAPGAPEPATWAMMIAGFGLVGAASRMKKAHMRVAHA